MGQAELLRWERKEKMTECWELLSQLKTFLFSELEFGENRRL
jgi:hypothetical protein